MAPACTETGLTEGKYCSVCGEILAAQEEVEATGHTYGEWTDVGAENHKKVCACGDTITEPHQFGEGTLCQICGYDKGMETYLITGGADQVVIKGFEKDVTITCNGEFGRFTGFKVDGEEPDPSNYTAVAGSTVLTLNKSYVETLTLGTHTIVFEYTTGRAQTNLIVKQAEVPNNPPTGDASHAALWTAVILLSMGIGIISLTAGRKKNAKSTRW